MSDDLIEYGVIIIQESVNLLLFNTLVQVCNQMLMLDFFNIISDKRCIFCRHFDFLVTF